MKYQQQLTLIKHLLHLPSALYKLNYLLYEAGVIIVSPISIANSNKDDIAGKW